MSEIEMLLDDADGTTLLQLYRGVEDRLRNRVSLPAIKIYAVPDEDYPDERDQDTYEAHCPKCDGQSVIELDVAERWNEVAEDGIEPAQVGAAYVVSVDLGDEPDFVGLCWECQDCGAALQLPDGVEVDYR